MFWGRLPGLSLTFAYADDHPVSERAVDAGAFDEVIGLPKVAARWLTALAVDRAGTESIPFSFPVPLDPTVGKPRLLVVAAGTNIYGDRSVGDLAAAETDATGSGRAPEKAVTFNWTLENKLRGCGEKVEHVLVTAGQGRRREAMLRRAASRRWKQGSTV